jgi:hypothetical protein
VLDLERHLKRKSNATKMKQMEQKRTQIKFAKIKKQLNDGTGPFSLEPQNNTILTRYTADNDTPAIERMNSLDNDNKGIRFYNRAPTNMESSIIS